MICFVATPNFSVIDHFQLNKPVEVNLENVKYGGRLWRYWMTQEENTNYKRDIANRVKEVFIKKKRNEQTIFSILFFKVNPVLELLKFAIRQSDYDLAVMFNLVNGLLPSVNETWARALTKQLREEILVRCFFFFSTTVTLVVF